MKKLILLLVLGSFALAAAAQMTRKPVFRPDYTFDKLPTPGNATYLYVKEQGEGKTKREALNQAIGRVFQSTANRIGQIVSTDEINRALQDGTDYDVIARNMKVPVNKVCEFAVQDTTDYTWTMYILCQVAKAGNITPEFETCEECTKHEIFDQALARWNQQQEDAKKKARKEVNKRNATALVASTFIPGMGQMLKKQGGKGAAFLLSEVVLFGGGTACYFLAQDQAKIMKAPGTSYDAYKEAKNNKNIWDIAMYSCFGVGAAVHIGNMVHAWCVEDRKKPAAITFAPAIISTNEYSQPSYAMGAGVQIKL